MPPCHVIVSTHTTRHLRRVLLGVASQSPRAGSIVVTSDNDLTEISTLVRACAAEFATPMRLVQRPFQGASRSSQVRNNGVRALLAAGSARDDDRLLFLDGDCCPMPDVIEAHDRLGGSGPGGGRPVVGFRIDLTPEQTEAFDEGALRAGRPPVQPTGEQRSALATRHARYRRHVLLRRLGLAKPHKPKLLSANFSVPLSLYRRVNGFDEEYVGYGQEDDDLGRRLYRSGPAPAVGVLDAIVYHQHHPTRAPAAWSESPNAARFARPWQARCQHGLESPLLQPEPAITGFG